MKKILIRYVLPLSVTFVIIWFFFRDISLGDIKNNFLRIPVRILVVFLLLSLAGTFLRALKYHILLSRKLSFSQIFLITLVRNFAVDLLPARSASLVFYTYLTKKKGISVEEGVSSFVVSVFYDGLALSLMLGGLAFFLSVGMNKTAIYSGMVIIFMISVLMIFLSDRVIKILLNTPMINRFPKIAGPLKNIFGYLEAHKKNAERLTVFVLSLLIRIIKYFFVYILFESVVGIGWGFKVFSIFSFSLAITELSSLLPIQGLAGFGTWELAFSVSFGALFGAYEISRTTLQSAGFVIHITTQVWEYLIGLAAFVTLLLRNGKKRQISVVIPAGGEIEPREKQP